MNLEPVLDRLRASVNQHMPVSSRCTIRATVGCVHAAASKYRSSAGLAACWAAEMFFDVWTWPPYVFQLRRACSFSSAVPAPTESCFVPQGCCVAFAWGTFHVGTACR